MSSSTRRLVVAATLCAGFGALSTAAAQPAAKGTAVISGRILAADTGLPLRRARVRVHGSGPNIPPGPDANRAAITDADGAFALTGLHAGRYRLEASKARYVDTAYGSRRSVLDRPIEVAEGQKVENITVSLPPAGVIVGHVLDELGEPVADAEVEPMQVFDSIKGRRLFSVGTSGRTDDIGAYRLYGLPPGTYYVSAQSDDATRSGIATAASTPGLAPTFFPGTAVAAEAQAIEVVAGGEAVADIAMVSVRLSAVTGVVVNAAGTLATGGSMSARPGMRFGGPQIEAEIKPDGSFALPGLAPGEYTVQARPSFEPRGPYPSAGEMAMNRRGLSTSVVVTGEPVSGLRLVLPDPIRIPVTVTFEDATAKRPENVTVFATGAGMGGSEVAMRGPGGRLTLDLSPGAWQFGASAPASWIVKWLAYRGEPLDVTDDVEITDAPGGRLEIVFTAKTANLAGSVKNPNGTPVTDYLVYVLTADEGRTYPSGRWMVTYVHPDQAGRFKTEHLRPGAYIALATGEPDPDAPMGHAEFMEWLQKGTPFRLRDGDTVTLDLTWEPRQSRQP